MISVDGIASMEVVVTAITPWLRHCPFLHWRIQAWADRAAAPP